MKSIREARSMSAVACRTVVTTLAVLVAVGGMPDRAALGEDRVEAPAQDPAEEQRRQQIRQHATHQEQVLSKVLNGDLQLLRASCGDLPRESRRAIAKAGEQAVKEAALRIAEMQLGGRMLRGQRGGGERAAKIPEDPLTVIAAALTKSVAEHVGNEQAEAFSKLLARRNDRCKTAMIHQVVAMLDAELVLTAAQRTEIERSLREKCDNDNWMGLAQGIHVNNGRRVFSGLPDECVRPHLTEAQRQRFGPRDANNGMRGQALRQQAWNLAWSMINDINNVPAVGRDPWWFQ